MSGLEHARGARLPARTSPFPPAWGGPPLDLDARAGWVAANLYADLTAAGHDTQIRALTQGVEPRRGPMDARLALLALRARERCPA